MHRETRFARIQQIEKKASNVASPLVLSLFYLQNAELFKMVDLVTHVPYITVIGVLIIALLLLSLYVVCVTRMRKRRSTHTQTYYTCMPRPVTDSQKEAHGLQRMTLVDGSKGVERETPRYSHEPVISTGRQTAATSAGGHMLTEIPAPSEALSSVNTGTEHNYENASAWGVYTNEAARKGRKEEYRVSRIGPVDTTRVYNDDDLISAAFTNDSFETYDEEYVNTEEMRRLAERK